LGWSTCFLLDNSRPIPNPAAGADIINLQRDKITTSELTVDRQVEHREGVFA